MAEESKAEKFCNATLDNFDDTALLSTLTMMQLVIENPNVAADLKYDAYATYGKVSLELDRRGH